MKNAPVYQSMPQGLTSFAAFAATELTPASLSLFMEDYKVHLRINQYGVILTQWDDHQSFPEQYLTVDEVVSLLAARYAAGGRESKTLDDSTPAAHCTWCAKTSAYLKKEVGA